LCVSNIDIAKVVAFHRKHGKVATVTAVRPVERFGALTIGNNLVRQFEEKPSDEGNLINGGFFVLSIKAVVPSAIGTCSKNFGRAAKRLGIFGGSDR
jgi:NDP-sugar pyrophosphorylase family protein